MGQSQATFLLIILNVLVAIVPIDRHLLATWALAPYDIPRLGRWYQLITSGFLHADFTHLLFNMLGLYFFGPHLETLLGSSRFLVVYLGSLVAGNLVAYVRHREDPRYRAIGASGAVSGVLFGFVLFFPMAKLYLFLLPIGIPAVLYAVGYVLVSIYGMRRRLGHIGHDAHLGGAIAGVVLTILFEPAVVRHFFANF
ncbi:MAG: rhomboid family intramembrane serine protease [Candidatus Eisenbacteria bacterium]